MRISTLIAVGCAVALHLASAATPQLYTSDTEIPIGGEGGWDILEVDSAAHRVYVVGSVPTAAGADGCAFDPVTQLAFASCGEGVTTIAKEETPEKLNVVQNLKTERGAGTMALDPQAHRIYLATARFEPPPSLAPGASSGRPKIVPNTMKMLVYRPGESKS
jgi:hypothetical protein